VRKSDEVFLGRTSEEPNGPSADIGRALIANEYDRLPDFSDPTGGVQAMIEFAHCVDACHRFRDPEDVHGEYFDRLRPLLREQRFDLATTQELWDGLFLECRADRFGGTGEIYREPWFRTTCDEILRRLKAPKSGTVLNRYRPMRDPRTLKLLDPACGSMHFGLYAFDIFLQIYREAWAWEAEHWPDASYRDKSPGLPPLHDVYRDEGAFVRDLPRLILDHNIFGVEIDPRAAQIASLALWLRAQRAWHDEEIRREDRPAIGRGHVIAAVAPPAEVDLRQELMAGMDAPDAELFERTLFLLRELPELGVLLRAEREVPALVREVVGSHGAIFRKDDEQQWEDSEARLRQALQQFGRAAAGSYRNWLFAEDALEGLRLIDLVGERFDAIVMNPPFGDRVTSTGQSLRRYYGDEKLDLYHYFYIRASTMLTEHGRVGAITPRTALYQSKYEGLRDWWLQLDTSPLCIAELGLGILDDATVRPALIVVGNNRAGQVFYCNLKHSKDPEADLQMSLELLIQGAFAKRSKLQKLSRYSSMPGKRLSLWAPDAVLDWFSSGRTLEPAFGKVTEGLTCEDDARFIRCWWEVVFAPETYWLPFGKFDSRCTFVPEFPMVIDWSPKGYKALGLVGNRRANETYYNKAGYAFTRSCEVGMATTTLPSGVVYAGVARYLIPAEAKSLGLLSYINTRLCEALHVILTPDRDRISGTLRKLPVVIDDGSIKSIESLAKIVWTKKESWLRSSSETYRNYFDVVAPLLSSGSLSERADAYITERQEVASIEERIEATVEQACPFSAEDIATLREEVEERSGERDLVCWNADFGTHRWWAAGMVSALVGLVFGRWDIRCALGVLSSNGDPNPFGSMPCLPPGMLLGPGGAFARCIQDLPAGYPIQPCFSSVLAEHGSPRESVVSGIREVLALLCQSHQPELDVSKVEDEICNALGCSTIEEYLRKPTGFFASHLRNYTKCGRTAPIYWPISTASGGYTLWLYYPALTDQTLFVAANDFVGATLERDVEPGLGALRLKSGRSREEERTLEGLQTQYDELRALREELLRLAPDWKPNHDDGVQITAAPLWRLFRYRPWQTVLRDTWEKLEAGAYDWAHLAMTYWPGRVGEKCRTDRSLAIAHNLDHLYGPPSEPIAKSGRGRRKKG
jgi:hypothetical protein